MISKFRLRNFRCFEDTGWQDLSQFTVLIGQNDGGKSSVLAAIEGVLTAANFEDGDHRVTGTPNAETELQREHEMIIELRVGAPLLEGTIRVTRKIGEGTVYEIEAEMVAEHELRVEISSLTVDKLKEISAIFGISVSGTNKSAYVAAVEEYKASRPMVQGTRTLPAAEIRSAYLVTSYGDSAAATDPKSEIIKFARNHYEMSCKEKFREKTKAHRDEVQVELDKQLQELVEDLREHCETIGAVSASVGENSFLNVDIGSVEVIGTNQAPVDWSRFGKGKKREMSLSIFRRQNTLLTKKLEEREEADQRCIVALFDEPDINLDYAAQRRISSSLAKLAMFPNCQVLAATHSSNLINSVPIEQVIFFGEGVPNAASRVWRFTPGTDDKELTQVLFHAIGLSNTSLANEHVFAVCSGKTEVAAIQILYPHIVQSSAEMDGVVILDAENDERALWAAQLLRRNGKRPILIIDRDSRTGEKAIPALKGKDFEKDLGLVEDDCFSMGEQEFEDCFSDEVWATVFNSIEVHPEAAVAKTWTATDIAKLRGDKFSRAILDEIGGFAVSPTSKPELGAKVVRAAIDSNSIPEVVAELVQHIGEAAKS